MAKRVDPDETPHYAASHLGLHSLLRPVRILTVNTVASNLITFTCIAFYRKDAAKKKKNVS